MNRFEDIAEAMGNNFINTDLYLTCNIANKDAKVFMESKELSKVLFP